MPDLHALLGDNYDGTVRAAGDAVRSELIRSGLAKMRSTEHDVARAALAAVLPDLLAAVWDEGHAVGVLDRPFIPAGHLPNPYRAEETA